MNLKKMLLTGLLIVSTLSLFAQEQKEGEYLFNPHWYMQIQGGAGHTIGEAKFGDLISPAAALNFGYQFNPLFGLRFGASGWQGKGGWASPAQDYSFKFIQGNVDAVLSLTDWFGGFKHNRFLNLYIFLGAGYNHAFDNGAVDVKTNSNYKLEYLWDDHQGSIVGRGGLGLNMRLSNMVDLNIEANSNTLSDKFNSKKAGNSDWHFNALIGLKIKLGKGYTYVAPAPVATPAPVEKPQPKEEPKPEVKEEPAPAPVVEKVKETMRQDVFFTINSSVVRSTEMAKINDLVMFMDKNSDAKVTVTGYADVQTGNDAVNMRISQARANAVKAALVKAGIAESRIVTDYKGDNEQPFAVNNQNRVTICIAE